MLKNRDGNWRILAFRHPLAGCQLVKGTIETGESAAAAALRELFEEAGIDSASIIGDLGIWETDYENQVWALYLCGADELPDHWTHRTEDDDGLKFSFFLQPLDEAPNAEWHPLYRNALRYIKSAIQSAPRLKCDF